MQSIKKMNKNENKQIRYRTIFWILFSIPFLFIITLFILISAGLMGPMPSFKELENPSNNLASQVYSSDKEVIGKFFIQNRTSIDFNNLSPNMVNGLIAIEDIRFKKHSGIDPIGLGRVLFKTILLGKSTGGGSTITQQLAKNLFGRDTASYDSKLMRAYHLCITKFKEWVTAVRLERNYTKKEILVMYLNTVFFGSQSYGVKSAANTFFNTTPDSLKIEEAALLAGVVNAPTRYNPVMHPESSILRRNTVLSQMKKYDFITKAQYDSLKKLPIKLEYKINNQNEGLAPYLREHIRQVMSADKPHRKNYQVYSDYRIDSVEWTTNPLYGWLSKNTKPDGSPYNLYKDGLKIYTTINADMQRYARRAVDKHLGNDIQKKFFNAKKGMTNAPFSKNLEDEQVKAIMDRALKNSRRYKLLKQKGLSPKAIQKTFNKPVKMTVFTYNGEKDTVMSPMDSLYYYKFILRAGFMAMNPHNGHIKAYVGGPSFKYFKYDYVHQAKRQIGSTIKPFLYTLAMQEEYSPCHEVPNVAQTFMIGDTTWTPKNAGKTGLEGEMVTLKWGLVNSVNYISAWLVKQFNPESVAKIMKKMGITSDIRAVPSMILGTSEISLYEMVGSYSTFANKGVHIHPVYITKIEDKNGNILTEFNPVKREAIGERTAYTMIKLLQDVVNEGTAIRLKLTYDLNNQIAGKTGTTQNQSDGWFMGITPNLVGGAWVGGEYRAIHFNNISLGQGANMALPIWALFMKDVYNNKSLGISQDDTFKNPEGFSISTECKNKQSSEDNNNYEIIDSDF